MDEHGLLAGKRVLVVEDEMLVLMAIEDLLSDLGCTSITVAGTLTKAADLVATRSFDLATLDVNLNGEKSYPIAAALSDHGIPFAFSTGYGQHGLDEAHQHCLVLDKPYTRPQFIDVISTLIGAGTPPALALSDEAAPQAASAMALLLATNRVSSTTSSAPAPRKPW